MNPISTFAKIQLYTERLFIRTYRYEDAADLHSFVKDNTYYLYETAPLTLRSNVSLSKSAEFLKIKEEQRLAGIGFWNAIFLKASNQFIGQISIYNLDKNDKSCELGYFITVDQMSRGYATEAVTVIVDYCFRQLACKKVNVRIKPDNVASKKVAQKVGFQKVGVQSKVFRTYHGHYIDQEVFCMLNSCCTK